MHRQELERAVERVEAATGRDALVDALTDLLEARSRQTAARTEARHRPLIRRVAEKIVDAAVELVRQRGVG